LKKATSRLIGFVLPNLLPMLVRLVMLTLSISVQAAQEDVSTVVYAHA